MVMTKRTHQCKVLFNDEEYAELQTLCAAAGRKPGTYCRLKALESSATSHPVYHLSSDLQPVLSHLGRIGNNLNQLAHHLNVGNVVDQVDAVALKVHLNQLHSQLVATQNLIREQVQT